MRHEWRRLRGFWTGLDRQTLTVLAAAPILVIAQYKLGSRSFFRFEVAPLLELPASGLLSWAWWFGVQGLLGFVAPVLLLLRFRRRPSDIGLAAGDWRYAITITLLYLPVVAMGTWVLSSQPMFQLKYPHHLPAAHDWGIFAAYEALFLFYWIGWEYLWRGFVLFGTRHSLGYWAILVQAMPFAVLHFGKPAAEAFLSVPGGILLGMLVWRCRSFWVAVPVHALQMLLLDLWCTLRIRTGVSGIGPDALIRLFTHHQA